MTAADKLILVLVALFVLACAMPRRRRGHGINNLRRWKRYGGSLERPPPPPPSVRKPP